MTTLVSTDARWLPVVNFAGLAYYVAWFGVAGPEVSEALWAFQRHAD
jgi:hypothetical protein